MTRKDELCQQERELREQLQKIQAEQEQIRQEEKQERYIKNVERLKWMRENKDVIIKLINHYRRDCVQGESVNSDGCDGCWATEILNEDWNNNYEILFEVHINKVE